MSTSTPETTIDADPNVPVVRIVREFDAPPPRVFACHADPELFARWCGPDDVAMTVETWDFRTGGSWRFHHMRGADTYSFYGSFHEVRPDELIVQTFTFCGVPDGVALERLRFVALGGAARGSRHHRSSTASRVATPCCPAAWTSACATGTPSSMRCWPPADALSGAPPWPRSAPGSSLR